MTIHTDNDGVTTNTNVQAFTTYGNPPESLLKFCRKHADKIREVGNEQDTADGYWIYLTKGWAWDGVHCVHEPTVQKAIRAFRYVRSCTCPDCGGAR